MTDLKLKLKKEGLKATKARLAILNIFSNSKAPKNAETIYNILKNDKATKNINEATVYRTINSLHSDNILKKVDLRQNSSFFEIEGEHHHHIVCTNCHRIEEFKNPRLEKLLKEAVEHSLNFKKITEHSLEFFGLCLNCSKQKNI